MEEINVALFAKDDPAAAGAGASNSETEMPRADVYPPGSTPLHPFLGLSSQILPIADRRARPAGRGQGTECSMCGLAFCPRSHYSQEEVMDPFCRWESGGLQGTVTSPKSCSSAELALGGAHRVA